MPDRPEEVARAIFASKRRRREQICRIPFEEKVLILVRLQRMASEIVAITGRRSRRPWQIGTDRGGAV